MNYIGLPWKPSGKESTPSNVGDMGLIPNLGRSHVLWSNKAGMLQLLSQLWSLGTTN